LADWTGLLAILILTVVAPTADLTNRGPASCRASQGYSVSLSLTSVRGGFIGQAKHSAGKTDSSGKAYFCPFYRLVTRRFGHNVPRGTSANVKMTNV
jgi:hypothetical protein